MYTYTCTYIPCGPHEISHQFVGFVEYITPCPMELNLSVDHAEDIPKNIPDNQKVIRVWYLNMGFLKLPFKFLIWK